MNIQRALGLTAAVGLWLGGAASAETPPKPDIVRQNDALRIPVAPQPYPGAPVLLECQATVSPAMRVTAVAFSPQQTLLAAASCREVVLWDLAEAKVSARLGAEEIRGAVHAVAFSKDGRSLAVGEGMPGRSGAVRLFDLQAGRQTAEWTQPKDVVHALAVSPDGKLLAAGAADGRAYVWNLADQELVGTIEGHAGWVLGVAFSPDGKFLATASADRSAQVWEVGSWKSLKKFPQPDVVHATAFTPDGKLLTWAVAGVQERMVRWREPVDEIEEKDQTAAKKPSPPPQVRTLDTAGAIPLALAWGLIPQGKQPAQPRLYVACADKTVKVYNSGGGLMSSLIGHGDWVYCVALSADGTYLASGSADGTVRLWNAAENRLLATFVQLAPGKDDWFILAQPGYFVASAPGLIGWNQLNLKIEPEKLGELLGNPEAVRDLLAGKKVTPPVLK